MLSHKMVANEPMGVNFAPMLHANNKEYTRFFASLESSPKTPNKTIGKLFKKLAPIALINPKITTDKSNFMISKINSLNSFFTSL